MTKDGWENPFDLAIIYKKIRERKQSRIKKKKKISRITELYHFVLLGLRT